METTLTTVKNNFFYGGQHARRFRNAARFRGEKDKVVFTRCFCCFHRQDKNPMALRSFAFGKFEPAGFGGI